MIPAEGGQPKQLTYYPARGPFAPRHGYDNQVMGWTPDGAAILFRSLRDVDAVRSEGRLYTVPAKGGLAQALPMPTSGAGDFSPTGSASRTRRSSATSDLEALPGRVGAGPLPLRPRDGRGKALRRHAAQRARPDVDR